MRPGPEGGFVFEFAEEAFAYGAGEVGVDVADGVPRGFVESDSVLHAAIGKLPAASGLRVSGRHPRTRWRSRSDRVLGGR